MLVHHPKRPQSVLCLTETSPTAHGNPLRGIILYLVTFVPLGDFSLVLFTVWPWLSTSFRRFTAGPPISLIISSVVAPLSDRYIAAAAFSLVPKAKPNNI